MFQEEKSQVYIDIDSLFVKIGCFGQKFPIRVVQIPLNLIYKLEFLELDNY